MPALTGAEYLAGAIDAYGVGAVFLVPTILSRTLYELERRTAVKRIVTHGEKAAVYMADGYARTTGHPGICMAQNVGAANIAAGLRDPYLARMPVIALTGGSYPISHGRHYYQEIEDFPLFKPVTKTSERVYDAARLPDLLAGAFRSAASGQPGPAHLELAGHAGDVLEESILTAELPEPTDWTMPLVRTAPDPVALDAAAAELARAERPLIVAGGGARVSGAADELIRLAERLQIPVATSLNAKELIGAGHPLAVGVPGLYARACANHVALEADLVFYVGSQTGSQVTCMWTVPPPATKVIHLDIEPTELGRHYPDTVALCGDAKLGLTMLLERLATRPAHADRTRWLRRVAELRSRWSADTEALRTSDQVPIRPERLASELSEALPDNAILVADTGHAGMWTGGFVDLHGSSQRFLRAAGSLGWGLPAAIGAQLAAPERPVVLFTGDGGLWYHVAELETAARWDVPVVVVVNNNRSLNQEIHPYRAAYGGELHGRHAELWHFRDVDLAAMAETLGVQGIAVNRASEFAAALQRAVDSRRPTLVSVQTDIEALAPKGTATPAVT